MKLVKLFLILVLFVLAAGCKKGYLDITPKGQMIPSTTDDYRLILDFVSNKNNVGPKVAVLVSYGVVNLLADDYQVSDSVQYKAMLNTDRKLWYYWGKQGVYNPDLDDPDWKALYGNIYIMNSAIEGLPNATGPQEEKDELMAEARFHRAFSYLGLVNIYAKHYTAANAATDLGVPLRLTTSLNEKLERKPVKAVYEQVLADLEAALPHLLSNQGIYNHRPTTAAAYALLARTYLFMGNYEKALENATRSLSIKSALYNYNAELQLTPGTRQYYFPTTHRSWDDKELLVQKETTYNTSMYHYSYPTIWGPTITALYDTANDLRFKHFFNKTTTGPGYTFAGTIKRYSDAFYYLQVGLSVPEMYLTRAEANARLGNKAAAIDDLNTIRKNRYLTAAFVNLDQSAYTQAQVLDLVKEERRRELWGKGLRWFDLKRYNALDNAGISITRFFSGDKLMPSDKEWVLPIGELYISMNPEIIQN